LARISLADLRERVYHRVEENRVFYAVEQVDEAINEALRVLNLFTGYNQDTVTLAPSVAGRVFYDIPASVIVPFQVIFERKSLEKTSISGLVRLVPDAFSQSSLAFGRPFYWAPIGIRKFALVPQDRRGGGELEVVGVMEPTPLVAPADSAQLADEFSELVEDYAFYTLTLAEGGAIFADASRLYQKFLGRMKELNMYQTMKNPQYFIDGKVAA